jgi:uncharacterized protein (DUF58 family)
MRRLNIDFPRKITEFEFAMKRRFLVRTIFYKKVFRGKGLEFESYRKYTENDDASLIDWKASMRTKDLLIRQYSEERDLKIFFIIDIGESMVFGSGEHLKNEIAAEIAACLSHLIITSGDSVGFAFYGADRTDTRTFSSGMKQFRVFERFLKNPRLYGGESNLKKLLKILPPYLKNVSAVFLLSDFIKMDEESLKMLKEFMNRHETIGIMVRDPVDTKLPDLKKEVVVEDIYTGKQVLINPDLIKYEYEKYSLEQKRKVENVFKKTGSDLLSIHIDKDFITPLVEFLRLRVKTKRAVVPQR